jgi:hypothetical protein
MKRALVLGSAFPTQSASAAADALWMGHLPGIVQSKLPYWRLHGQNDSCADGGESQAELEIISVDVVATSDCVASTTPRYANASDSGRNAT